ncbi:MAG: hypothetical protein V4488_25395 [Pseudomonadota bacterium]
MDNLDQDSDVIMRLVAEMVSCCPEEWTKGVLTIECADGAYLSYKLRNEEEPGKGEISDELRTLIDEFYGRGFQTGKPWAKAVVSFQRTGDDLGFNVSYTPLIFARQKAKPFWKFW